jgi:signal transduction histidine kinase
LHFDEFGVEHEDPDQQKTNTICRVVQELVSNTLRHAAAKKTGRARISKTGVAIIVGDDGKGFDAIKESSTGSLVQDIPVFFSTRILKERSSHCRSVQWRR